MKQGLTVWKTSPLSELATVQSGVGFPKKYQGNETGDYPVYKVGDVSRAYLGANGELDKATNYVSKETASVLKGKVFEENTILFAKIGEALNLNRRVIVRRKGLADNNVMGVIPSNEVEPQYLYRFLQFFDISSLSRSTTVPSIRKSDVEMISVPHPNKQEQKKIANRLDSIFAKLEMAQSRLEKVPQLLIRFRMSVLSAAVSGELTEEWRHQHQSGVWKDMSIGALTTDIRYGTSKKCDYDSSLTPVLRIPNIVNGSIDASDLKFSAFNSKEITKLSLQKGDILVIRSNGSVELVGKPALITEKHEGYLFAGYLIRIRLSSNDVVIPEYLNLALQSPHVRSVIEINARSTSGINNINSKELAALTVPAPSPSEQKEIVRVVSELLAKSDLIKKQYEAAKLRVDKLTHSILARAFRGELFEPFSDKADRVVKPQSSDEIDEQPTTRDEIALEQVDISTVQTQPIPKVVDDKSELLSHLRTIKKSMSAQQLFDNASIETFKAIDELFTELKRLLELKLVEKVGEGECQFKATKK